MNIQEQAKIIRREGVIVDRFDREKVDGVVTGLFIEWQGNEWFIRMKNGVVMSCRNLDIKVQSILDKVNSK